MHCEIVQINIKSIQKIVPVAGCEQVPADEVKVIEQEGERNMAQEVEEKEESEVEVVKKEDKMIMTQQEGEEEASNAVQVLEKTED